MDADEDSQVNNVDKKNSRYINISESKFHIDGIRAEMIVEVENDTENNASSPSPAKILSEANQDEEDISSQDETLASDDLMKVDFAKNLGLVCPIQENDSLDKVEEKKDKDHDESNTDDSPKTKDSKKKKRRSGVFLKKLPKKKRVAKIVDSPVLKPGKGKELGDISFISKTLQAPKTQGIKPLYRVIFNSWPVQSQEEIKNQILKFSGFTFNESSQEYNKRKSILKSLPFTTLQHICHILEIKSTEKPEIIKNILNFLQKPYEKKTFPAAFADKFVQPSVCLKRIDNDPRIIKKVENGFVRYFLKEDSLSPVKENKTNIPTARPKRSIIKKEDSEFVKDIKSIKKTHPGRPPLVKKQPERPSITKLTQRPQMKAKPRGRPVKLKSRYKLAQKLKAISLLKKNESLMKQEVKPKPIVKEQEIKSKPIVKEQEIKPKPIVEEQEISNDESSNEDSPVLMTRRIGEKYKKLLEGNFNSEPPVNMARRTAEKRKKPVLYGEWLNENDDSSDTRSADETLQLNEEDTASSFTKHKKLRSKGLPLRSFPIIKKNIESASNNVIERLHVIVFGTSFEPEKMRKNLLEFDGFDFAPDSEEWKQKTFFLSLVANNYLLEFTQILNLDSTKKTESKPNSIIECLMNFLKAPSSEYISTKKDVKSPVKSPIKVAVPFRNKVAKKSITKPSKKDEKPKSGKRRKMLMDESEVRKLELEIAREERAKKRATMHNPSFQGTLSFDYNQDYANSQAKSMLTVIRNNRVLKAAGIDPIVPLNTTRVLKLGDNSHVQFMIVALNYPDLEILHNLIYLHDAVKSRIRKNILEFEGFKFDESSENYKFRETFLRRLGLPIVKRISFIFGLTPLNTNLPLEDIIDLIMHFLMCPSKAKQVPIKEFPPNFFQDYPTSYDKKNIFQGISGELLEDNLRKPEARPISPIIVTPDLHNVEDDFGIPVAEVYNDKKSDSPSSSMSRKNNSAKSVLSNVRPLVQPRIAQTAIRSPKPVQSAPPLFVLQPQIPGQPQTPVTAIRPAFPPATPLQFQILKNTGDTLPTTTPGSKIFFLKVPQPVTAPLPPLKLMPSSTPTPSSSVKLAPQPSPPRIPRAMKSFTNLSRPSPSAPPKRVDTPPPPDSPEPEQIVLSSEDDDEGIICHKSQFEQDVFLKIRDIILSSSMEDITLKKITEKLVHFFPTLDTNSNQELIKSSIKKVICGMTSPMDD